MYYDWNRPQWIANFQNHISLEKSLDRSKANGEVAHRTRHKPQKRFTFGGSTPQMGTKNLNGSGSVYLPVNAGSITTGRMPISNVKDINTLSKFNPISKGQVNSQDHLHQVYKNYYNSIRLDGMRDVTFNGNYPSKKYCVY